jgi:curved DNA-binding protein CbpA
MSSEFYDQLGVDRGASAARIRSSYGQAIAKVARRRRALVEQGGDTAQIDLQRARLDEAWEVLSDPLRRRRYDAMLQWTESRREPDADTLWDEVADALVHPAAAVAAKLLRVTAKLTEIGQLPLAPSGADEDPPTLLPHDDDLTQPRVSAARLGSHAPPNEPTETTATARLTRPSATPDGSGSVVDLPSAAEHAPDEGLRVVDGSPGASSVIVMPTRQPDVSAEDLARLVDEHGYSGALLRAVRELRHITLQDMADHTRISVRYLEAIEGEVWDGLPSATFVRGYVREMARMLGLDDGEVVAGYMRRSSG